jgi:hypothetical protein
MRRTRPKTRAPSTLVHGRRGGYRRLRPRSPSCGTPGRILSSDLDRPGNPLHPDGLEAFFDALLKEGFTQADLDIMAGTNPARVLGLPER